LLVPLVGAEPLGVRDLDRHRGPERPPVAHPADDRDLVLLEAHPRAAPVAEPPSGQLVCYVVDRHRHACGEPFDDDHQATTVGLASSEEPEHGTTIPALRAPAGNRVRVRSTRVGARTPRAGGGQRPRAARTTEATVPRASAGPNGNGALRPRTTSSTATQTGPTRLASSSALSTWVTEPTGSTADHPIHPSTPPATTPRRTSPKPSMRGDSRYTRPSSPPNTAAPASAPPNDGSGI